VREVRGSEGEGASSTELLHNLQTLTGHNRRWIYVLSGKK
jgi:hypothetical protein